MTRFASLLALSLSTSGCFFFGSEETPFLTADDVRLDLPESLATREGGTQVRGDLHMAVERSADRVNGWVTLIVEHSAKVVAYLDDLPPTSRDGEIRVYGPFDDDQGRDLSWLVRLETLADGSSFDLYVGGRGAKAQEEMDLLMTGDLHSTDTSRSGGFTMDFDVVEKHGEIKGPDAEMSVIGGSVEVSFERDVETEEKKIDLDFKAVSFEYLGYLDDDVFFSDDAYAYHRGADGSGSFALAVFGEWDDYGWSGPEQEKMTVKAAWTAKGEGRTFGEIVEVDGVGDMKYGDLSLGECFGSDGFLTWRALNEPYALEVSSYNFSDEATCALAVSDLP